jgi:phage/plasmid-associated DNA primase
MSSPLSILSDLNNAIKFADQVRAFIKYTLTLFPEMETFNGFAITHNG